MGIKNGFLRFNTRDAKRRKPKKTYRNFSMRISQLFGAIGLRYLARLRALFGSGG